jgi:hypothetical protein
VYSFDTRLQRTDTKKATKLIPFLSVRTPREEVTAFGGSLEYKRGSLILIDLTLDKFYQQSSVIAIPTFFLKYVWLSCFRMLRGKVCGDKH